jgi:hypothetical protein
MDTLKIGVQNSSSLLSSSTVIMIGDKSWDVRSFISLGPWMIMGSKAALDQL